MSSIRDRQGQTIEDIARYLGVSIASGYPMLGGMAGGAANVGGQLLRAHAQRQVSGGEWDEDPDLAAAYERGYSMMPLADRATQWYDRTARETADSLGGPAGQFALDLGAGLATGGLSVFPFIKLRLLDTPAIKPVYREYVSRIGDKPEWVTPQVIAEGHAQVPKHLQRYLSPVSTTDVDEFMAQGKNAYAAHGGKTGYVLAEGTTVKTGEPALDLQAVYNAGAPRGAGTRMVNDALSRTRQAEVISTLDAFDADGGRLVDHYRSLGYREVKRDKYNPDFDEDKLWFKEKPDVVYMQLDPNAPELIQEAPGGKSLHSKYPRARRRDPQVESAAVGTGTLTRGGVFEGELTEGRWHGEAAMKHSDEYGRFPENADMFKLDDGTFITRDDAHRRFGGSSSEELVTKKFPVGEMSPILDNIDIEDLPSRAVTGALSPHLGRVRPGEQSVSVFSTHPTGRSLWDTRIGALRERALDVPQEGLTDFGAIPRGKTGKTGMTPKMQAEYDTVVRQLAERRPELLALAEQGVEVGGDAWYRLGTMYDAMAREVGEEQAWMQLQQLVANTAVSSSGATTPLNATRAWNALAAQNRGMPLHRQAIDPETGKLHNVNPGGMWPIGGHTGLGWLAKTDEIGALASRGEAPMSIIDPLKMPKHYQYGRSLLGQLEHGGPFDLHIARQVLGDPAAPDRKYLPGSGWEKPHAKLEAARDRLAAIPKTQKAKRRAAKARVDAAVKAMKKFEVQAAGPGGHQAFGEFLAREAGGLNLKPSELMSAGWVGGRELTNVNDARNYAQVMQTALEEMAIVATKETGRSVTPEDLFKRILNGDVPKKWLVGSPLAAYVGATQAYEQAQGSSGPLAQEDQL